MSGGELEKIVVDNNSALGSLATPLTGHSETNKRHPPQHLF